MTVLGLALAALLGLSLGLLGGGGSILTVPILVYVLGWGAKQAIAPSRPTLSGMEGMKRPGAASLHRCTRSGGPLRTPMMLRRPTTSIVCSITASSVVGDQIGSAHQGADLGCAAMGAPGCTPIRLGSGGSVRRVGCR